MQDAVASLPSRIVTLGIDREVFGVSVHAVREILDLVPLWRLPDAPPHVAGLIDVRGQAVPVIDLRARLGLPPVPPTPATRVLVLDITIEGRALALGLIVDRVFEVAEVDRAAVQPPPDIGSGWRTEHIKAIVRHGEQFVIVLDLAALLGSSELAHLPAMAEAAASQAAVPAE